MLKFIRKLLKISAFALPVLALGGWWSADNVLPYIPIKPFRVDPAAQKWRLPAGHRPEDYGLRAELLDIRTADSLTLKAFFFAAPPENLAPEKPRGFFEAKNPAAPRLTLIILHGISGCKEHYLPVAQRFVKEGVSVALLDLRAHGQSEGEFCTFGFREKHDVSALVDTLLAHDPDQKIGIMGNSLGGAIALQALAIDPRLRFGIIESTFHDLESVALEYGQDYSGLRSPWLTHRTLEKSAAIAHFDPFSVKPFEAARQIRQPVFMAHGDRDDRIPIAFGRLNFENLASPEKEWHTVAGAGHRGLWQRGGQEYVGALMGFLRHQR